MIPDWRAEIYLPVFRNDPCLQGILDLINAFNSLNLPYAKLLVAGTPFDKTMAYEIIHLKEETSNIQTKTMYKAYHFTSHRLEPLGQHNLAMVRKFDWDTIAAKTDKVYRAK
jgi:hypothetical protein